MNVSVSVKADVQPDGSVRCNVECNGQEAALLFTGQDVLIDIPEPRQTP